MATQARAGLPGTETGHVIRDSSLGLVPETIDAILKLQDLIWHHSSIAPALSETLRLRNANAVNCVICRNVRYDIARKDGLTEEQVANIGGAAGAARLTGEQRLAVAFADIYLDDPQRRDESLAAALRARFATEQICHMAIALTFFNALSRCAVSIGGMPETMPVTEVSVPALR
jgi:alkylhydroperoxidase family enzyme